MNGRAVLGALLVLLGVGWLLAVTDVVDVDPSTALAVVLIAVGLAVVLVPRGHGLLVALAVPLLFVGLFAVLVDADRFEGGVGENREEPASLADVEDAYRLGIGELVVDLTAVDFGGQTVEVDASVGIGQLVVDVPDDVTVRVDAEGGIGNLEILDEQRSGLGLELEAEQQGDPAAGALHLHVEIGIGDAKVR